MKASPPPSAMPVLMASKDGTGYLPIAKRENLFPSIHSTKNGKSLSPEKINATNHAGSIAHTVQSGRCQTPNSDTGVISPLPLPDAGTSFKLPSLGHSWSNGMTGMVCKKRGCNMSTGRTPDDISKCNASYASSSSLGVGHLNGSLKNSGETTFLNGSFNHGENTSRVKLPNIFQRQNNHKPSLTNLTPRSRTNLQTNNRSSTPFSFSPHPAFLNLSRNEITLKRLSTKLCRATDTDYERSGTQCSALLLPISTVMNSKNAARGNTMINSKNTNKGKRKREKINRSIPVGGKLCEERLLREKLEAIQSHGSSRGVRPASGVDQNYLGETDCVAKATSKAT